MSKIINRETKEAIIEDKNLSIKELVEKAVRGGISLEYADLRGVDLNNSNLGFAVIFGADLTDADLRNCDLRGADLTDADLRNCDLTDADLGGAELDGCKFHKDQLKDLLKGLKIKVMKKKENDNT